MHALILPARNGWRWLGSGYRLFRRNPAQFSLLVLLYWLLLLFLNLFPFVGGVAASLAMPLLSVGLMNGCRDLEQGRRVQPAVLFAGMRQNPRLLFALGGWYLVATLAVLGLTAAIDGGDLLNAVLGGKLPDDPEHSLMLVATLIGLGLLVPLMMAWWYAPLLVAWHHHSLAKSLFFSFFACLRNWRAFLAYSLAVALWSAVLPGLILGVVSSLLPGGMSFIATVLTVPLLMVLAPSLVASFYQSYRDVFVEEGASTGPGTYVDEIVR